MGDDKIPQLPFERDNILDVAAQYRTLQTECPLTQVRTSAGDTAWLVTGHAEVKALLKEERLGRTHPDPERAPRFSKIAMFAGSFGRYEQESAKRARMRQVLTPVFSPRRMAAIRPRVNQIVDELLDHVASCPVPVDLHETLCFPLPVLIICELLGVPDEDRHHFRPWAEGWASFTNPTALQAVTHEFVDYFVQAIRHKRTHPTDDLISALATADGHAAVSDEENARLLAGLMFTGHTTTVVRIDLGTVLLLDSPAQRAALAADPTLIEGAVEEILRMVSSGGGGGGVPRYAHDDIVVGEVTIHAGDAVLLAREVADRDPRVFDCPDRFDITRSPNRHLAFGVGSRFCLGASLARIQLQAVFPALLRRFPTLQLAVPVRDLELRTDLITGGLRCLPVTW